MDENKQRAIIISLAVLGLLIYLFYDWTNIGYLDSLEYYEPIFAPLWFECLVTVIFVPFLVYEYLADTMYQND